VTRPVTVIVLCWNRWELTRRCLETLHANTDLGTVEVLVVDNGSEDETPARLAEIPWIRTLRNPTNLGYVRGNNAGIAATDPSRDVLLLNNDIEILEPGWVDALRRTAHSAPDIGVVGCRLRLPDGRLLHAGTFILPETMWGQQIGALERDVNQFANDRDVQGIVFACAYLRREVIDAIGGLSEAYQSYFEDTDYCLRAHAAGFRTVCCGAVTLLHHEHGSTSDTPELFDAIFQKSRAEFRRRWTAPLEAVHDLGVHFQSVTNAAHGYATSCRGLLRRLDERGLRVTYSYLYGPGTPVPHGEPENSGDYYLNVIRDRSHKRHPEISVVYGLGNLFDRSVGRYKVGYTMLEVDGFPAEWVRQANALDEVWVPSAFAREAFRRCGVTRPIHVMPLGVDTDRFHPGARGFPNPSGDFVFLTSLEWGERKAPELLLQTFNETFRASDPVVLVCKVLNRDATVSVRRAVEALHLHRAGGRIAFLFNRELPYAELPALYRSADCFVSAGHGEGWDMPLMEAMACGLPSIATSWGAHWEYLHDGIAYPLRIRGTIPAVAACPYYAGFSWGDPDPRHLGELLRHVFENRAEAAEKGRRAAAEVASRWSADAAADRIAARLYAIAGKSPNLMRGAPSPPPAPLAGSSRTSVPASGRKVVALDVSRAIGEQVSGVGRYAVNVATGLAGRDPGFDVLLLPGLGSYVHPAYLRHWAYTGARGPTARLYDGPLPAFSGNGSAPAVALLHSTAFAAPRDLAVPMVYTVHDLSFLTHPEHHTAENIAFCTENLERAVRSGATFVAVSEQTRRDLLERTKAPPAKVHVVPNTFDASRFRPYPAATVREVRARYGLPDGYLLFLASLEPRKNLATVLSALEGTDGLTLVVAGASGWNNSPLVAAMEAAGSKVIRLGYVPDDALGPLYAGASALVYPSLYEGFGLPVLEAMACGTPVITSNVSSLPEVTGEAGVLLDDPLDAAGLRTAMERVAGDAAERARLSAAGLERARRFALDRVTDELLAVYRTVLG